MSIRYIFACLASFGLLAASGMAHQNLVRIEGAPDITELQPALGGAAPRLGTLRIGLALKNIDSSGSDAFVASQYDPQSPNFHKWIDGEEFGRRFGAPDTDVAALTQYLAAHGFRNVTISQTKLFISADGSQDQVEKAFNTKIEVFQRPFYMVIKGEPATTFAPTEPPKLPALLASKVASVQGLTDLLMQHPANLAMQKVKVGAGGYTPYDLSTAYDTDWLHSRGYYGQSMNIAVYSPTEWHKTDVNTFATAITNIDKDFADGYPISGYTINEITVDGGSTNTNGATEASLDVETIVGQAPNATVNLIEPKNGITYEIDAYNKILALKYPVVSSSWSNEEYTIIQDKLQSSDTAYNNTMKSLAAAGISVFQSAGDSGAFARNNYPARDIVKQVEIGG